MWRKRKRMTRRSDEDGRIIIIAVAAAANAPAAAKILTPWTIMDHDENAVYTLSG